MHQLTLSLSFSFPLSLIPLLSSLVAIYRMSDPWTPGDNNSCTISLSLSDFLSIFLLLLAMYIQPLPPFMLLPFHHSVLSLSLAVILLKSCRQEQKGTKLSQRTSHWLLVDFSFKFIFKQHLFILNRWEYISRHYNANDGTHIFLRIFVVGVGVWACRQMQVSMCVPVPNPRSVKTEPLPTL